MKTGTIIMIAVGTLLIAGTTVFSLGFLSTSPDDQDPVPPDRVPTRPRLVSAEDDVLWLGLSLDQTVVSRSDTDALLLVEVNAKENGNTARTPVSIALVLDASGSMAGNKITNARQAAHSFIDQLADGDILSILSFDTSVTTHLANFTVTADRSAAHAAVNQIEAGGGTCVSCGLQSAYSLLSDAGLGRLRRVILMSDGHANSGISDAYGLRQLSSTASQGQQIATATIGLGQDHDEHLLSAIAVAGSASYYFLHNSAFLAQILQQELASLSRTAVSELSIELVPADGVTLMDTANTTVHADGRNLVIAVGQIAAGQKRVYLIPMTLSQGELSTVVSARAVFTPVNGTKREIEVAAAMARSDDVEQIAASINPKVLEQRAIIDSVAQIEQALDAYEAGERDRAFVILQSNADQVRQVAIGMGGSEALEVEAASAESLRQTLSTAVVSGSPEERGNIIFNRARSQDVQRGETREAAFHQDGMYDLSITE